MWRFNEELRMKNEEFRGCYRGYSLRLNEDLKPKNRIL